jgi:DnaJ like chaperone protein
MNFWIYLLIILYILSPYDLLPDFFIGVGWIDDLILLGLLGWYHFIYRRRKYSNQRGDQRYRYYSEGNQGRFRQNESFKKGASFEEKTRDSDPYQILGIKKDASLDEIKVAYRRMANQYHPDKVMHLGEEFKILAEKRFKEIQEAYQELKTR